MSKILCIGEALIDMICTDKGKPLSAGENFLKKPGGAPTNVAAAIAALGGKVELAAKVGVDPFGDHLVAVMKSFGVSTKHMLQDETQFTTFAFVSLMENGERDFYFNRGADGHLNTKEINAISLDEFGIVHFGSATGFLPGDLQDAYVSLLKNSLDKKLFITFDPNYRHLLFRNNTASFIKQSWNYLEHCHFFKVSDEEAMMLTGAASVEAAAISFLDKTSAVFAITLGKEGADLNKFMEFVKFSCRDNGRTGFQWDTTANAGFTTGTPWLKTNPNYKTINAAIQEKDESSCLNYFRKMVKLRKDNLALVYGKYTLLDKDNPAVYAYTREYEEKKFLVLLNFTAKEATVKTGIDISKGKVLINNYGITSGSETLKPYEAAVIEL